LKYMKAFFAVAFILIALSAAHAGGDCEVVGFSAFESVRPTRTDSGMLLPMAQRCAEVTFRNTGFRAKYATSFRLTASFRGGGKESAWVESDEDRFRRLLPGEEFTAAACFGPNDSEISEIKCE